MIRTISYCGPFSKLSFRIDHLIGAISCKKSGVYVSGSPCNDILRAEILEKCGRLQGTLEIVADRDYAHVIAADGERFHKIGAGTVADQSVCHIGEHSIYTVFTDVNGHDLMSQLIELSGAVSSESSQSYDKNIFSSHIGTSR